MSKPPDNVYTLTEAAEHLRLTNRGVAKLAKQHGLCMVRGRDILFTDSDIEGIKEVMRPAPKEPNRKTVIAPPSFGMKDLTWVFGSPPTKADKRVRGILRWLALQRVPKSYKQIERAGPTTISQMLADGFVVDCGNDVDNDTLVKISEGGREQLRIAEKWAKAREQHGKRSKS